MEKSIEELRQNGSAGSDKVNQLDKKVAVQENSLDYLKLAVTKTIPAALEVTNDRLQEAHDKIDKQTFRMALVTGGIIVGAFVVENLFFS